MSEKIVCERVLSSTETTMVLGGATHSDLEFREAVAVGSVCEYELIYTTRSQFSQLIENGLAVLAEVNILKRVSTFQSFRGSGVPYTFEEEIYEEGSISVGAYFARLRKPPDGTKVDEASGATPSRERA
jgi:hypothetical protein